MQWFFCVLSLPKTFVLVGSFCSRKVTHEASINIAWRLNINIAWRLNIKTLKFDTVYSIDKIWKIFKVSLSPYFQQNALHKKYKIWVTAVESIISSNHLRKLIVCWKFQRLCGAYMFCYLIYNNGSLIKKFINSNFQKSCFYLLQ